MGSLYRLKQKFVDFCNTTNQIEDSTLTVPTSHVVYGLNQTITELNNHNLLSTARQLNISFGSMVNYTSESHDIKLFLSSDSTWGILNGYCNLASFTCTSNPEITLSNTGLTSISNDINYGFCWMFAWSSSDNIGWMVRKTNGDLNLHVSATVSTATIATIRFTGLVIL